MSAKKQRECYWCGARVWKAKRIVLAGPARRRVYECRDEKRCLDREMRSRHG